MSNPSKAKGDAFEWDLIKVANEPDGPLVAAGLTTERTRAGYERDEGDLLVLTPDRQRLASLQAKNRRERKWSEWLADTERQGDTARARFAALLVKRNGLGDVARSYAITTVREYLRLLGALYAAETERDALRVEVARLRQGRPVAPGPAAAAAGLAHRGIRDVTAFERLMRGPEPDERGA